MSKKLCENLHWQSVHPAPRIAIDFGDGRKIERTITGDSIHYVWTDAAAENRVIQGLQADQRTFALMKYRKTNFDTILKERTKTIDTTGVKPTESKAGTAAILAAPLAVAKAIVVDEYSILRVHDDFAKFEPSVNFDDWSKLARVYTPTKLLDANGIAFIRRQNARTGLTESEFAGLFAKLESFIALDTTRNDFLYHTKLYEWLNQGGANNVDSLNARVYDQLFHTPNTDKWLGLYSSDVYTALDGNGIIK